MASTIGMALAGKTASVDIPKSRDGGLIGSRDNLTVVSAIAGKKKPGMLPTPPNSISPNLPPHRRRDSHTLTAPASPPSAHLESDVEFHEPDHGQEHGQGNTALSTEALDSLGDLDSAGAITPGMLAKHHLPDVLLSHGPLAIRHIMGYLTTSVPGFSRITSAKARRLVVAALEGRGSGIEGGGGGVEGRVVFDKVGWGRWDARLKGQPPRERQSGNMTPPGSLPSSYSHHAVNIPGQRSWPTEPDQLGSSATANSAVFSRSDLDEDERDAIEEEADRMSLDGKDDGYASSSSPAPDPMLDIDMLEGDETDEEDWASIGAAALRAQSLPTNKRLLSGGGHLYQPVAYISRGISRTPAPNLAKSVPIRSNLATSGPQGFQLPNDVGGFDDSGERAAIEALLSLGSM